MVRWSPFARNIVGRQLVEASDSIGGNIAEGYGRYHYKDNRQLQFYARGSLEETGHWLRRALRRNLISEGRYEDLMNKIPVHIVLNQQAALLGAAHFALTMQ